MRRFVVLAALFAAACSNEAAPPESDSPAAAPAEVTVTGAWCRPTPEGRAMTACYASFNATTDDRLVSVISPRAARSEIHEVSTEGGVMRMSEMEGGLPLPAGQAIALAAGGDHIMLMDVTVPLAEGDMVPLAFTFESGVQVALEAPVRAAPPEGGPVHAGHGA